jgi:hypothetical protein
LTVLTGRHRSTIWKVLKRHGVWVCPMFCVGSG